MRLSNKGEYACLAMVDLARHYSNDFIKIVDISERKKIPRKFLEQIIVDLKRGGLVNTKKGSNGGCRLATSPCDISLAQIIRLIDGALAPTASASVYYHQETPVKNNKKLMKVFRDLRNIISKHLENTKLSDLI